MFRFGIHDIPDLSCRDILAKGTEDSEFRLQFVCFAPQSFYCPIEQ